MPRIAVGSNNPAKVDASKEVAERIWNDYNLSSFDVQSGVSDQPNTDREAVRGARNRAYRAREEAGADLGIGLEGSTCELPWGTFLTGWSVVVGQEEEAMIGGGGRLQLPDHISRELHQGRELGEIMEELEGREGIGRDIGAIGIFTGELVTRKEAYKEALIFSLARLLKPDHYRR